MSAESATPESTPAPRKSVFTRRGAAGVAAWFLLLCSIPGLGLLAGGRAVNLEGSKPPAVPRLRASKVLDSGYWTQVGTWLANQEPFRDNAITLNADIAVKLLGDSTTKKVVLGSHGWMYTADDADLAACVPGTAPPADLRGSVEQMHSDAAKRGKRLVVVLSPDKSPSYPQFFPSSWPTKGCIGSYDTAFRTAFRTNPVPWIPDTWALVDQVAKGGHDAFYRTDSHLSPLTRVAEAQSVIDVLQPGLWTPAAVVNVGMRERQTDLARQLGLHHFERQPYVEVRRPGVVTTPAQKVVGTDREHQVESFVRYRSTGAPMIQGRTVILHDSQFALASADLMPWFADVTFVHWDLYGDPRVGEELKNADTIVVETVQRATWQRLGTPLPALFRQLFG